MDTKSRRTIYPAERTKRMEHASTTELKLTCLLKVRVQVTIHLGEERSHWEQQTAAQSVVNTGSFKDRASHGGGVRSNNRTSAYVRIEKDFFWFTENKNSLIYTKYTCIYMHQNICLYIIHVHTTDNVRPKQWPHALSNKLQVFYENLQVFYENLQVFYGI